MQSVQFFPSNVVLIGAKFQVSLSNVILIGTSGLFFPQQRGFDWYEAKFYVSTGTRFWLMQLFYIELAQSYLLFMRYPWLVNCVFI